MKIEQMDPLKKNANLGEEKLFCPRGYHPTEAEISANESATVYGEIDILNLTDAELSVESIFRTFEGKGHSITVHIGEQSFEFTNVKPGTKVVISVNEKGVPSIQMQESPMQSNGRSLKTAKASLRG